MPTVLFIDNEKKMRKMFSDILSKKYKVFTANGRYGKFEETEKMLNSEKIDVILCDILMPREQHGRKLFESLVKMVENIPIIMLTVLDDRKSAVWFMEGEKAFNYLIKEEVEKDNELLFNAINTAIEFVELQEKNKQLEEKLNKAERLAHLGAVAGGVAHDIINPLTVIQQMARFISKEKSLDIIKKYTKDIIAQSERIDTIASDLRYYVREEKESIDINSIIDDVAEILKDPYKDSYDLSKIIKTDYKAKSRIFATKMGLEQVFMNLIKNAIQALEKQKNPKIDIKTYEDDDSIVVEISDNGVGIPKEEQTKIFIPLHTTRRKRGGMGLGLVIVKKNIDRLKGEIDVQSEVNKGTTFTIKFPKKVKST